MDFLVTPDPSRPIRGTVSVPGDKSVSHRAAILSALGEGPVRIHGFLDGSDCRNTLFALIALGVHIEHDESALIVHGRGLCGLQGAGVPIDCGNSGTGMRLLMGVLATQAFESELHGDESLMQRPMRRVADPLISAGADIETSERGTPPVRIHPPGRRIEPIKYDLPIASAQVKSALLLAGLCAGVPVTVTEPAVSRDHTERMLRAFGVPVSTEGNVVSLQPLPRLDSPDAIDVPGDLSSAAFLLVMAAISSDAELHLRRVGVNPTRSGVLDLLKRMGADINIDARDGRGGEPLADITVKSSRLKGIDIDAADVALAIDEIPILMIAAACAQGTMRLRGAEELRVKESDRLKAMAKGLQALGIEVVEHPDGLDVTGGAFGGGAVDSHGDHRIAMAFVIAATVAAGPVRVENVDNVATSFPGFRQQMVNFGIDIQELTT